MIPELQTFCARYVPAVLEVIHGIRPVHQLMRHTSGALLAKINQRVGESVTIQHRKPRSFRVHKVHVQMLTPAVCEATVLVHDGMRFHAAALRLEFQRNRWMAQAIQYA